MGGKSVTVIGGGIAGMSTAVFLFREGFDVTVLEATHKIGGRAYSFHDEETGITFDNGQHILAGWYDNTFEFFSAIGKRPKLRANPNLEVYFRIICLIWKMLNFIIIILIILYLHTNNFVKLLNF